MNPLSYQYLTPGHRVTAYTYASDTYCRDCMWEIAVNWIDIPAELRAELRSENVEDALDALAKHLGVDRYDEGSFDSGDFPKVVFETQVCSDIDPDDEDGDGHEHCGGCRTRLCEQ